MSTAAPYFAKGIVRRILSQPLRGRAAEFLREPRYSLGRLRDRWYECSHPELPLLTPKANRFLSNRLSKDAVGFEWGSGRSTRWFARNCARLVSIEHSAEWFQFVSNSLRDCSLSNVDFRLVPLDHEETLPTVPVYDRVPSYVAQIAEYPDQHFDFCLVDGHYRQACILAAMPKLRPGGLLIVDDSQWMPLQAWGVRADWELALRGNSSTKETTIWKAKAITLKTKP